MVSLVGQNNSVKATAAKTQQFPHLLKKRKLSRAAEHKPLCRLHSNHTLGSRSSLGTRRAAWRSDLADERSPRGKFSRLLLPQGQSLPPFPSSYGKAEVEASAAAESPSQTNSSHFTITLRVMRSTLSETRPFTRRGLTSRRQGPWLCRFKCAAVTSIIGPRWLRRWETASCPDHQSKQQIKTFAELTDGEMTTSNARTDGSCRKTWGFLSNKSRCLQPVWCKLLITTEMQSFSAQFVESECLLLLITSVSCKADFLHQLAYYCYSKAKWSNSLKKC